MRDTYDNSIAIVTFKERSDKLSISSDVDVDLYYDNPVDSHRVHSPALTPSNTPRKNTSI
jgi:hypothetical protein